MTTSANIRRVSGDSSFGNRTVRKLKIRILPWLFLLFVVAYIDRINIGFAALTMNRELGISSNQFGIAAGIFFFGYFIFEVPSNLILAQDRRPYLDGAHSADLGHCGACNRLRSATSINCTRCAFCWELRKRDIFPGIILYLSYWFRRSERSQAVALFIAAVPIASIFGAPLSGVVLDHSHWLGVSSWRWLLILEGLPAIVCGLLTYFVLPSWPSEATFLSSEEREWLRADLAREE